MVLLALAEPCASESSIGTRSAAAHIAFRVNVPPVLKVLGVTPTVGGLEYRVWTNMKSIVIDGKEYRFTRVGEATLLVPSSDATFIVHGL
ncbi:hypothetical protein SAMN05444680_12054 [Variovorax sp. YR216]|nr:hypothetical protein SAMN05444680_12054 [Variovorax sp. YR216]